VCGCVVLSYGVGDSFPFFFFPGRLLAAAAVASGPGVDDLLDVEYLDAAVGAVAELDGHVPRHEGAADAHPLLLPVDQVAVRPGLALHVSPDPLVAPVMQ